MFRWILTRTSLLNRSLCYISVMLDSLKSLYEYYVDDEHFPLCEEYEGVSKSFRTGGLERELQMEQLSATRCSYIAIL
jgi:hypothetical protein